MEPRLSGGRFLAAALLLCTAWLAYYSTGTVARAADLLMRAVEQVCAAGIMTPDLGGKATTAEVTNAVCEAVRGMNR